MKHKPEDEFVDADCRTTPLDAAELEVIDEILGAQSPQRRRLVEVHGHLTELRQQAAEAQAQVAEASNAQAKVEAAEAALKAHLFECELQGRTDHQQRHRLRAEVVGARALVADATAAAQRLAELNGRISVLETERRALERAVLTEVADGLADAWQSLEAWSLAYRTALGRLRDGLRVQANRASKAEEREIDAAILAMNARMNYGANPAEAAERRNAVIAAAERYAAPFFQYAEALSVDPLFDITADPEVL